MGKMLIAVYKSDINTNNPYFVLIAHAQSKINTRGAREGLRGPREEANRVDFSQTKADQHEAVRWTLGPASLQAGSRDRMHVHLRDAGAAGGGVAAAGRGSSGTRKLQKKENCRKRGSSLVDSVFVDSVFVDLAFVALVFIRKIST